ncbi:MAG TPA: RluA family pseudouridine synthase [Polyangiaceae bacterium]
MVVVVVPREAGGSRLDRFVTGAVGASRAEVQRWIEAGRVTVDGATGDASARVREGQRVEVRPMVAPATEAKPESDVRFDVMYVDDDVVVVNKPPGLVVHPARGHEGGTLVNGLLARGYFRREELGDDERPGIVHRLDKGTSGVMVVARTAAARERLKEQFQAHTIERAYEAVVVGEAREGTHATLHGRHPRDRMRFTSRVKSGKRAVTHVRVLARLAGATHVECTLETGRTHQIRVHLAESGTPVLGDPLYGKPPRDAHVRDVAERLGHQALHARVLGFVHPRTREPMRFEAPPPGDFAEALAALGPARGAP